MFSVKDGQESDVPDDVPLDMDFAINFDSPDNQFLNIENDYPLPILSAAGIQQLDPMDEPIFGSDTLFGAASHSTMQLKQSSFDVYADPEEQNMEDPF